MNAPQIIRTASGEELVVLTKADYEALLHGADGDAEDAEDIAIYDALGREIATLVDASPQWLTNLTTRY